MASEDAEVIIAQFIRRDFIALGRDLKSMVLILVQPKVAEHFLGPTILASNVRTIF
jgi:hypothetical protein